MFKTVSDYLSSQSIPYQSSSDGAEVIIQCLFCDDQKKHLYINNLEGCFYCQRCGAKGSWQNLIENLGDTSLPVLESQQNQSKVEYRAKLKTNLPAQGLAEKYHQSLPERITAYLKSDKRGLTQESINKFLIGWDGQSITIPVFNTDGKLINIRHRRDPKKSTGQKMWNEKGCGVNLFNIGILAELRKKKGSSVLITEGEFDCIIANQNGFPAVTGTAGANTFKEEWVKEFDGIETVYICYDTDEQGKEGAKKVARLFDNKARIVKLPQVGEEKDDLTDYFTILEHSPEDFRQLLNEAKSYKPKVKLLDQPFETTLHPAIDFKDNQLFYTFELPVEEDNKRKVGFVTLSSRGKIGIDSQRIGIVTIDDRTYELRDVTHIPGSHLRWDVKDINQFLKDKKKPSSALPYVEIKEVLNKFVDFRKESDADIITLWLIATYCFPIFDAFPYLYFVGVKRSGKTKTLLLIEKLAFNAILSSNISPAVLFRLVEAKRPTLALDEGEQLADKSRKQELRELLNSGYKKGAPVYRATKTSNGSFEVEGFEVYSPKAIANISGLDEVLEDRAIPITMVRTNNPDKGNLAVTESSENWPYLRSLLYSFAFNYAEEVCHHYHNNPEVNALLNRQNELWRPLLSIAKVIDSQQPGLFEGIKNEAIRRAEETASSDLGDYDSAVLMALRELTQVNDGQELTNKEIKEKAHQFLEEDQKQYLTSRGIGATLKRFGIRGKKNHGYWRYVAKFEEIKDLLGRYGLPTEETFG